MVYILSWEQEFMLSSVGLKFDRVLPWADLTNVVVITIVPVETLIRVSPVHYRTVPLHFWAGGSSTHNPPLHSRRPPLHFLYASLTLSVHLL